ncbi:MAG: FAD-binding oxidoreductase [Rhodococcus sp. (in: high G+C Gram-positive bacteria)]
MTNDSHFDVIVIGGGIAGVSIAYELAEDHRVCLLEMESTLAFHTTGRSAAAFIESYGNKPIRALTTASRSIFIDPPEIFESTLTTPIPLLYLAKEGRAQAIRDLHADVSVLTPAVEILEPRDAEVANPLLRQGFTELAMLDPGALDVDVHALHQGYARGLRRRGGKVVTSSPLVRAERREGMWTLTDRQQVPYRGTVVVNAAGAWCDEVARTLGADPVGIQPFRRTVFMISAPDAVSSANLPLTIEVDDAFYFKPEGNQLLCSPADEDPQEPGNARPDELAIAQALEAINDATVIGARHVRQTWAGQRSFTADRTPVVGFAPNVDGVFWFAGQGGYGIQICPALARTGAALLRSGEIPDDVAARGLTEEMLAPARQALTVART